MRSLELLVPNSLFVQVQTAIGQTGHQEYGQTKDSNVRIWTEKGGAVIRLVAKGIKMTATVKMELRNPSQKFIGNLFLYHGKEMDIKMVKNSKIRLPDEMMTAGK